jgi:hypothetical protein
MIRNLYILAIAALAVSPGASAFAGEIYKYVDDSGNIHFVDRPTGQSGEERLQITYARTSDTTVNAQVEQRHYFMEAREKAREEELSQREAEQQLKAEAEQRAARCHDHRARLESYLQARRLYRENQAGEREYLSDSEILAARQKVEQEIQETCS